MPKTVDPEGAPETSPQSARGPGVPPGRSAARAVIGQARQVQATTAGKLRARLGLTQTQFAPMLPLSVRSLAALEHGADPTEAVARRLTELKRLVTGLSEVMKKESIGRWLLTPNPAFEGSTPIQVLERGEADRLWQMLYLLRSGIAF